MKHLSLLKPRTAPGPAQTIVMITPPSAFLLDERVFMSLGILKVAAVLEKAGHRIELLDLSGVENFLDVVDAHLRSTTSKVVAITATTPQMPAVTKIARLVRELRPDVRIIIGGPHVTLAYSAVKLEKKASRIGRAHRAMQQLEESFDVLVAGDGEFAVFEALRADAPKLVDGDSKDGGLFMSHAEYDESPYPARHLVDVGSYNYTIDGRRALSAIFQLGCSYRCTFCGGRNSRALRVIRTRTTQSIINEIEMLYQTYGITAVMAYDDEINLSRTMVELMDALTALQQRLGVEFRLRGFVKAELFTDAQAASMYRAGFRWILCGFEAASPRILGNIEKQATIEDNTRVMEIARRHGIKVKALMSVGHAGESKESITAVHDWLLEVKPDDFDCTVITTYPGTPYYDEALPHDVLPDVWTYTARKSGDRLHAYDVDFTQTAEYYKGNPDDYHSYVFTDHLAAQQIVNMRNWVERDVRAKLGIPFNAGAAARRYEHSMGQAPLPPFVLRTSSR